MPAAVVISAGFREAGDEGRAREAELRVWLREAPLRLVGPNCLGWIRPASRLNLTFAPGMPPAVGHGGVPTDRSMRGLTGFPKARAT